MGRVKLPDITLNCTQCNSPIVISTSKYRKRLKAVKNPDNIFCSRVCNGLFYQKISKLNLIEYNSKVKAGLCKPICIPRRDEYSPFRVFLNGSKKKTHWEYNDLTLDYLKSLYEQQNGECAITNIPMFLPNSVSDYRYSKGIKPLHTASLDRIDSTQPYKQGNVQFVCKGINLMKNTFTMDETIDFLNKLKEYYR